MESTNLFEIIQDYENYVKLSFEAFEEVFCIDNSPIIAHRRGEIPKIGSLTYKDFILDFHFHGIGCRCTYNKKIIVDFDYRFTTFDYKGFEVYKLLLFIHSSSVYEDKTTISELILALNSLVKKGIIQKKDASNNIDTYDFFCENSLST